MIATVRTKGRSSLVIANFEAMKFGLDFEPHADNTFDITVHDNVMLDHIVKKCNGTVIATQDFTQFGGV